MNFQLLTILLVLTAVFMGGACDMSPSIKEVKARYEPQILQKAGVVSVGIGLDKNGREAIIIGLDGPNPETEAHLPSELEGYPVIVQNVGRIKAQ